MTADLCWVDGVLSDSLPLPDRGFAFGDGLFETLLLVDGRAVLAEFHQQRLARGLEVLGFPVPALSLDAVIAQAAAAAPAGAAALRVTVTRGSGPRGYAPPLPVTPRVVAQLTPLAVEPAHWQVPARLGVSATVCPSRPALAGLKHLNRLEQVLAAAECQRERWDEAVMLDADGAAVSVIAGNLFAVVEGKLMTPDVADCGVAGTRRRAVIERWAPALNLSVAQARLSVAELEAVDEVFYCNSLQGIRAVAQIGTRSWGDTPVARALHNLHCRELTAVGPA
ncbi:aminodeoxychorismate lyase [Parahaliea maris]|uniref:Aminodeoxychorismate lyase n=1 Tax=Parahaliea maris TaxID=2716870 RepID=A0A5C8ZNC3_9GAMM|nr:aminodeoxychorismate lyase [Parahaliea maris]TXS89057.1 aminodeoxychorismate lyase [Parahaliea maris]